jgi:hypothetical protein
MILDGMAASLAASARRVCRFCRQARTTIAAISSVFAQILPYSARE